jgi:hypothetical protein
MQKLFDDNLKIDQLKVYPLATSEPFWARFAESMDKEGCFIITRKSLQQGIDKYSKTKK